VEQNGRCRQLGVSRGLIILTDNLDDEQLLAFLVVAVGELVVAAETVLV
jgi:hypothetical protein